jgi:hypothetical protein
MGSLFLASSFYLHGGLSPFYRLTKWGGPRSQGMTHNFTSSQVHNSTTTEHSVQQKRTLDSEDFDTKRVRLDRYIQPHNSTSRQSKDISKMLRRCLEVTDGSYRSLVPVGEQWSALKQENSDSPSETNLLKEENRSLHSKVEALETQQLKLYAGNMLIALGKLAFPKVATNSTTHRLQQRLQSATVDQELAAAKIPPKYWSYLKNITKVYCCFPGSSDPRIVAR